MTDNHTPFTEAKIDDIKRLIDEGYEVVDVREDWEWNKGHIPGARHVVLASLLANPTRHEFRDRSIFVCEVGERSAVASEMAVALPRRHESLARSWPTIGQMSEPASALLREEDVIEVLRACYDPEIPVNIVDLGLIYEIAIKPQRVDVKMTLTALGCPMAGEVMGDVRDHLLTLPGVEDAGVELVYDPPWTPERMSEEARWELGMV